MASFQGPSSSKQPEAGCPAAPEQCEVEVVSVVEIMSEEIIKLLLYENGLMFMQQQMQHSVLQFPVCSACHIEYDIVCRQHCPTEICDGSNAHM